MNRFVRVEFQNYGAFRGRHEFDFSNRGMCLIVGKNLDDPKMESNGAAKSTLLDALDWCLYGKVPRKDSADSVVNESEKKDCEVTAILDLAGVEVVATRRRKCKELENGFFFTVDGVAGHVHDPKESQRRFEELIGMDRDIFHATCLFAQGDDWTFAEGTDSQRKDILTRIMPEMVDVDLWLDHATKKRDELREDFDRLTNELTQASTHEEALRANDPRPLAGQWARDRAAHLDSLFQQIQTAHAEIAQIGEGLPDLPEPFPPSLPDGMAQARADYAEASRISEMRKRELAEATGERKAMDRAIALFQTSQTCPTCGQAVDPGIPPPADFGPIDRRMADSAQAVTDAVARQESISAQIVAMERWHGEATAHHSYQVESVRAENTRRQTAARRAQEIQTRIDQLHRSISAPAANPYEDKVAEWQSRMAEAGQRVEAARTELLHAEDSREYVEFWVRAFGPSGIKSHILDSRLQEMTDAANDLVQFLTGGVCWVRFETQKKVGRGKTERLVDKFEVRCFRHNPDGTETERAFRSWSGGEKDRLATGIDFGLARLVSRRARSSWDLLALDEFFGRSLDAAGKDSAAELLGRFMAEEKSNILVIDHDRRFQGMFDHTVVIEKKNGESRILEEI